MRSSKKLGYYLIMCSLLQSKYVQRCTEQTTSRPSHVAATVAPHMWARTKMSSLVLPSPTQTQKHHMCSKHFPLSMSFEGSRYLFWIALVALQMGAMSNAPTLSFDNRPYDSGYSLLAWTIFLFLPRTICTLLSQMSVGLDEPKV